MDVTEYSSHDLVSLAHLIQSGQVTARQVQDAARAAIAAVNDQINGVAGPVFDEALAYDANGTFAGAPYAMKDNFTAIDGIPTTDGSRLLADHVFDFDAVHMQKVRAAGLAVLCRTTAPEFGSNLTTESLLFGPTRNPWNLDKSSGGSSGGTSALVAAGALPAASGSDGAGSIRIPAALTGTVGLKPTRGRISNGPLDDDGLFGLACEGTITRTVRDTAAVLDAVRGSVPGDKWHVADPLEPYTNYVDKDPGHLNVLVLDNLLGFSAQSEPAQALRSVADELSDAGHAVSETDLSFVSFERLTKAFLSLWPAAAAGIDDPESPPDLSQIEATSRLLVEIYRSMSVDDLMEALVEMNTMSREVANALGDYDVVLSPVTSGPTWDIGYFDADHEYESGEAWFETMLAQIPFTPLWNFTGQPAISLPLATSSDGMPMGIQFAAPWGREDTLISLAGRFEKTRPWISNRPSVWTH